jgi:hypothetical protein
MSLENSRLPISRAAHERVAFTIDEPMAFYGRSAARIAEKRV